MCRYLHTVCGVCKWAPGHHFYTIYTTGWKTLDFVTCLIWFAYVGLLTFNGNSFPFQRKELKKLNFTEQILISVSQTCHVPRATVPHLLRFRNIPQLRYSRRNILFGVRSRVPAVSIINPLTPNDHYMGRTAQLTSRSCILYIYWTNKRTEYFKHAA